MDNLWTTLEPHVIELLGLVLTIIIGIAARQLSAWTGIEIQKRHREALHEALMSGAMSAIKHGPSVGLGTLKAHAIAHARQSVPEAVKALVPGDGVLDAIAERYVRDVLRKLDRPTLE
ncbi:hypothetical protein [Roseivivax isoporae]|uniref:Uncharacterized protein n=1 Tax=Roseivivax isoporae LMG 25204 TaxID=1449351 RepID=X7F1R0_9RHOB|nr:hypothetical protein [Roseivivax isoporae]ETX26725.1 hypothetical protein RISW2_20550 [Roseivivax isoporae LMG 25204]